MTTSKVSGLLSNLNLLRSELGNRLRVVKRGATYRDEIGAGIDTWYDYIRSIGLSQSEATSLIELAEWANEVCETEPDWIHIPYPSLKILAKKKVFDPEIISSAKVLTLKDFKERYYDYKTKDKGPRTYSYMVMRRCNETGTLERVPDEEISNVKLDSNGGR